MNIDKIIFTCDEKKEYVGFWNSISKYYKNKIGILPVLYFIGNLNNFDLNQNYGEVRQIKPVSNVPTRIQALWGKFYFTKDEPETTWIIGDLDLYHFHADYFQIEGYYEYAHLNEGHYGSVWRSNPNVDLPGYYHVAKGQTFIDIFDLKRDFEEYVTYIKNCKKYGISFRFMSKEQVEQWSGDEVGYHCCEEHLSTEILRQKINNYSFFGKTLSHSSRIDKDQINGNLDYLKALINNKQKLDMHCPRPYEKYADKIESLIY